MSYRFRASGLALLAVLALGAVGSASAQAGEFTWAGTTKNIDFVPDAKSIQKFGFSHAGVECNEMTGSAAVTEGTIGSTEILTSSFTYDDSRAVLADACTGPGGAMPHLR